MSNGWDEAKHPRVPAGSNLGGEFANASGGPNQGSTSSTHAVMKSKPGTHTKLDPNVSASDYTQQMSDLRDVKPRPINKLWNNPSAAPPEQVARAQQQLRDWNAKYSRVSKLQKLALARDNAAFAARNR